MDPIAKTAYYCCGVRMLDAQSANPVCGDHLAERFMDEEARALFRRFEGFAAPNASNAARHRIVDDLLRERLAADPELPVVLLGAGFDTRAFRLEGGRWLEVDQPALIDLKNRILPADGAPNPLLRIPVEFGRDDVHGKLAAWCEGASPGVVVMEGVSMYLSPQQLGYTLAVLHRLLPRHTLICDLMTKDFARRYSEPMRRVIRELGGDFAAEMLDDPADFVAARGYRPGADYSIAGRAVQHGSVKIPRWLFNTLLRRLRDGYRLHVFEAGA
jgi:methyltransferase (TIGR00027 family)